MFGGTADFWRVKKAAADFKVELRTGVGKNEEEYLS